MPTPVSMFKTDDGQLFADIKEAIMHEQKGFISAGLTPLLSRLYSQASGRELLSEDEEVVNSLVAALAADRELIAEFQKLFAKVQLTVATPAKRKRASRKKPAKVDPPAVDPPAGQIVAVGQMVPLVVTSPSVDPSEEELAAIGDLAGDPIVVPEAPSDEQAPPPPQA